MRYIILLILSLSVAAFIWCRPTGDEPHQTGYIEYRGEKIRMAKAYGSFEDYKDAQDNLDAKELPKIEKLMSEAKLPSEFGSRAEAVKAIIGLKFPGYGIGFSGEK